MVLMGRINKQIVKGINKTGSLAVGISGLDGNLIQSRELGDGSHGLVGEVTKINPEILDPLISKGYIPIISSIGSTMDGISHNINADFVAGEIAAAINAEKLILLTDTQGILKEKDNKNSLVEKTNLKEARDFIDKKIIEMEISNLFWLILLILILYMKIPDQLLHMVYHQ